MNDLKLAAAIFKGMVEGKTKKSFKVPPGLKQCDNSAECESIKACIFSPGEKEESIVLYFLNPGSAITLTNKRFIKIEDEKIASQVSLNQIKKIEHKKSEDKIIVDAETKEIFCIHQSNVAEFFANTLQKLIAK